MLIGCQNQSQTDNNNGRRKKKMSKLPNNNMNKSGTSIKRKAAPRLEDRALPVARVEIGEG